MLLFVPLVVVWLLLPEIGRPRTFVVAGCGAWLLTVDLYGNVISECMRRNERRREAQVLMYGALAAPPVLAILTSNTIPVVFAGTAVVAVAAACRLESIRRRLEG